MKKWTKEQIDYLKEISPGKYDQEIMTLINYKFGTNYTKCAINSQKRKQKIKSNIDFSKKYSKEVIDFMIENYQGKDNIELANLLNEKFNLDTTGDRVCMLKANLIRRYGINLRTGINRGCFKKGSTPSNKGKKWDEYMSKEGQENSRKTCFKKGNISFNADPIGTEKIKYHSDNKGYLCVKVCDGKGGDNWIPKHRLIYEKEYGPIPEGHKVIFADGDRNNFDINNLILVSDSEELILNRNRLIFKGESELTKTGVNIAKVINKVNERRKERKL